MNKTCARCEKTVYPTEELKCLDKVWHKGCFKCQECGMTLNMRTYKGYGKLPYCEAHVPKAKPTTMAETPELKRIAENTKLQSNVKYHADFEKSKGKFTQVADDPETLRIKANTKIISNVAYHGDLEKKAQMERQRQINENGEIVDAHTDNYHQQIENYATEMLPPTSAPHLPPKNHYQAPQTQYQNQYKTETYKPNQNTYKHDQNTYKPDQNTYKHDQNTYKHDQNTYKHDQNAYKPDQNTYRPDQNTYKPDQNTYKHDQNTYKPDQHTHKHDQNTYKPDQNYRSEQYQPEQYRQEYGLDNYSEQYYNQYSDPKYGYNYQQGYGQQIGRIQDYDPLTDGPRTVPNTQRASATLIYNSTSDKRGAHQSHSAPQQQRQIGRVSDMDPMADDQPRPANHQTQNQRVYVAMYDYEANDSDEVSFREGDLISNVTSIDEGWMTGQVLRTGRTGMLPANYVELAPANSHVPYAH